MQKYIITIALILFVTPSLANAAWWNPFTWFKKTVNPPKVLQVEITKPVRVLVATTTPVSTTTPGLKKDVSVKPAIAPSVRNTDQSTEIEKLKKEVEELKSRQATSQPVPASTPQMVPVDPLLRVEQCKAKTNQARAILEETSRSAADGKTLRFAQSLSSTFAPGTVNPSDLSTIVQRYKQNLIRDLNSKIEVETQSFYIKCLNES